MDATIADSTASVAEGRDAPTGAAGDMQADWRDALPGTLRDHPALSRAKDLAALAKEHVNLQSLIGRKGIIPPGDNASPAELDRYHAALGRPEAPADYGFAPPDGLPDGVYDQALAGAFAEAAHRAGLSDRQAHALHDWFVERARAGLAGRGEAAAGNARAAESELRREWGGDYDRKMEEARRAARSFAGEDALESLDAALGTAAVARLFQRIGAAFGEDSFTGGAPRFSTGPSEARAEINRVLGDAAHPYWDRLHPEHKSAVARMQDMFAIKTVRA